MANNVDLKSKLILKTLCSCQCWKSIKVFWWKLKFRELCIFGSSTDVSKHLKASRNRKQKCFSQLILSHIKAHICLVCTISSLFYWPSLWSAPVVKQCNSFQCTINFGLTRAQKGISHPEASNELMLCCLLLGGHAIWIYGTPARNRSFKHFQKCAITTSVIKSSDFQIFCLLFLMYHLPQNKANSTGTNQ